MTIVTTAHTPGPWTQIVYAGDQHTSIVNADQTHIAAVNKKNDAALIAAAPELLALAYDFGQMLNGMDPYSVDDVSIMRDKIKAAIAKATYQQGQ